MSTPVNLPALGESVTEGTITRWLKSVGDSVEVDEPLLEVSTDKVDTEIPSPVAGTLLEIKAEEDETVEVGAELAIIGEEGEGGGSSESSDDSSSDDSSEEPAEEPEEEPEESSDEAEESDGSMADEEEEQKPAAAKSGGSGGGGTPVTLPALGESVTEGTVTRWLKAVGDTVAADEPLLEVSTDKVDTEIPSPVAGTVLEIKVQEDETADVGADLAIIGTPGNAPAAAPAPQQAPA
ncbi:MAG TPA: biotin/lipoyl-containing protein, partial [Solirubrobacteraceae bacterium]|nr:biotin/lipoyl-containing protein [Solirubrobacteraceae bacterium]